MGTCIIALMRFSARADYALVPRSTGRGQQRPCHGRSVCPCPADTGQVPGNLLTQLRREGLSAASADPTADSGWRARRRDSLADYQGHRRPAAGVRGERPENVTYPGVAEALQQVWIALRANERAVLKQVTLADIVSGTLPDMVRPLTETQRLGLRTARPA